jgi:hypothetical protein
MRGDAGIPDGIMNCTAYIRAWGGVVVKALRY